MDMLRRLISCRIIIIIINYTQPKPLNWHSWWSVKQRSCVGC